jgi:flagellar biosynthesis GTPase FlhF
MAAWMMPAAIAATGIMSQRGAKAANAANAQLAHNQMQFQERLSRTAYQRQVDDMKAAGINPMLSARMGGASTPSGQTAVMQNTAKAGVEAAMMAASLKNMQATARKTNAEAENIEKTADSYQRRENQSNENLIYDLKKRLARVKVTVNGQETELGNYYDSKLQAEVAKLSLEQKRALFTLDGVPTGLKSPLAYEIQKVKEQFLKLNADRSIQQKENEWWAILKGARFAKDVLDLRRYVPLGNRSNTSRRAQSWRN